MHTILALYDAQLPALGAMRSLAAAGVAPPDVWCASAPAGAPPALALPAVDGGLAGALVDLGVPAGDADLAAEAVRRGAILVVARVPTLSAPPARAAMRRFGPLDLAVERARWSSHASVRYGGDAPAPPPLAPARPPAGRAHDPDPAHAAGAAPDPDPAHAASAAPDPDSARAAGAAPEPDPAHAAGAAPLEDGSTEPRAGVV